MRVSWCRYFGPKVPHNMNQNNKDGDKIVFVLKVPQIKVSLSQKTNLQSVYLGIVCFVIRQWYEISSESCQIFFCCSSFIGLVLGFGGIPFVNESDSSVSPIFRTEPPKNKAKSASFRSSLWRHRKICRVGTDQHMFGPGSKQASPSPPHIANKSFSGICVCVIFPMKWTTSLRR